MPPLALNLDGVPTFLLGVSYLSRVGGPRMWERFDEAAVRQELQQMRAIGLNTCRSLMFLPSFMPQPPAVNDVAAARLRKFFGLCRQTGMTTIPTALTGHLAGQSYGFSGQAGRSPYTNSELLDWQQAMVQVVAELGAGHPGVVAYAVGHKVPLWGGAAEPQAVAAWARAMCQALRERDDQRPVGLGDGVLNLRGGQNGFDPRLLRKQVDYLGPHTNPVDQDPLRQALGAEFSLRGVTHLGLPVLLEEFGCAETQASEQHQALYFREVLHACLSVGAAGAVAKRFSDFELSEQTPFSHHAHELGFGVTRADGSEKQVCHELRSFRGLLDAVDYPRLEPPRPRAALLVPSCFNTQYPFSWEDRGRMHRVLLQAYTLCAGADQEAELLPEGSDLSPYALIIVPSTQKLLATTWRDLRGHAEQGNVVYWSYYGGSAAHQGAWCHGFEALTGCRHQLRYGCPDLPADPCRVSGPELTLELPSTGEGDAFCRSLLPLEPLTAEVLAVDARGRASLTMQRHGNGAVVLFNHPWEYYLSGQAAAAGPHPPHRLYRLLARLARLPPRVSASGGGVQARVVGAADGPLLWLFNHGWEATSTTVDSPGGAALCGVDRALEEGRVELELAPKQVAVWRLNESRAEVRAAEPTIRTVPY